MTDHLPRNLDAERALLSACLLQPNSFAKLRGRLTPDLFTSDNHLRVLRAMQALHKAGLALTPVSILAEIDRDEDESARFRETHGVALLGDLTACGIPSTAVETYLTLAEECAHKRQILSVTHELTELAKNGSDAAQMAQAFAVYAKRMERVLSAREDVRTVNVVAALSEELPPVPWIADGWFGEGDLVIFGGEWATGKSLIALDLAIAVALGVPWLGRIPITRPGPVLYVDEENNARNVSRRLARMIRGRNVEPTDAAGIPLRYLSKNAIRLDSTNGLATLRKEIETHRPRLVILDSLIRFHSASENDNTEIAAVFSEIVALSAKYNCAFVVLDHMRKPSKDDDRFDTGHRIRGAGDKAGVGDGLWTLEGNRDTDERTLSCRKNRWEDSLPPAITTKWCVSEDETAAWIEAKDATLSAELVVRTAVNSAGGSIMFTPLIDAAKARGVSISTAKRTIKRLVSEGTLRRTDLPGKKVMYEAT